jgi:hypothetical protein
VIYLGYILQIIFKSPIIFSHQIENISFHIPARTTPFRVSFYTNAGDADGAAASAAAADMADSNELSNEPRGNLGFSLAFFQTACA